MSHDIIADALNKIMNAKRAGKKTVVINIHSKVLERVLEIGEKLGYIEIFNINKTELEVTIGNLNDCGVIKPRHAFTKDNLEKFMRRYLPAANMGVLVVSTNQGIMTHQESDEKNIGGCLIAYFY